MGEKSGQTGMLTKSAPQYERGDWELEQPGDQPLRKVAWAHETKRGRVEEAEKVTGSSNNKRVQHEGTHPINNKSNGRAG